MSTVNNLTNQRFGRLLVLKRNGSNKQGAAVWLAVCDCGNRKRVIGQLLVQNLTRSCGCLRSETALRVGFQRKHGHRSGARRETDRTYASWVSAKSRCFNLNNHNYKRYYGKAGITMCVRWRDSFESFLADMGERPRGTTLDRYPNKGGNYEPGNCRWATPKQQASNRRPKITKTVQIVRRVTLDIVRSWNTDLADAAS